MTTAKTGPGTPEHFYAVGGVGEPALNPATGEPILNPVSGQPVIQEHPRVEAEASLEAAEAKLAKVEERYARDKAACDEAIADASALVDGADARYAEILADLVAKSEGA